MIETELDLLRENRAWQRLLDLYRRQLEARKAELAATEAAGSGPVPPEAVSIDPSAETVSGESEQEESEVAASEENSAEPGSERHPAAEDEARWVPRIVELGNVPPEELSQMHGQLIAWGLLEFQLAGRASGVHYRLSRLGVQLLNRLSQTEAAESYDAIPA